MGSLFYLWNSAVHARICLHVKLQNMKGVMFHTL